MEGTPNRSKRLNLSEPQTRQSASRASTAPKSGYQTREGFNGEEPERAPRPNAGRRVYQVTLATEPREPHHQGKALRGKIKKIKKRRRKEREEKKRQGGERKDNQMRELKEEERRRRREGTSTWEMIRPFRVPTHANHLTGLNRPQTGSQTGRGLAVKTRESAPNHAQARDRLSPQLCCTNQPPLTNGRPRKERGGKKSGGGPPAEHAPRGGGAREPREKREREEGRPKGQKKKKRKRKKTKKKKDRKEIKKGTAQHKGRTIQGGRRPDRTGGRQRERQRRRTDWKRHEPKAPAAREHKNRYSAA